MNMEKDGLIQHVYRALEGAIVTRINIGAGNGNELVGLDAGAFEAHAVGGLVVKLTDVQHAAIR